MGKLTLGDLGLIKKKVREDLSSKELQEEYNLWKMGYNQAVDLINKITVEEVVEVAINLGGLDYVHRDEICRFCECKLFHEEGCQCENDE